MLIDQTDEEFKKMPKGEWPNPEEEEFQMLERQLSGWRKRQIEKEKKEIDKYDPSKIFIQAGWYKKEEVLDMLKKFGDKNEKNN